MTTSAWRGVPDVAHGMQSNELVYTLMLNLWNKSQEVVNSDREWRPLDSVAGNRPVKIAPAN